MTQISLNETKLTFSCTDRSARRSKNTNSDQLDACALIMAEYVLFSLMRNIREIASIVHDSRCVCVCVSVCTGIFVCILCCPCFPLLRCVHVRIRSLHMLTCVCLCVFVCTLSLGPRFSGGSSVKTRSGHIYHYVCVCVST